MHLKILKNLFHLRVLPQSLTRQLPPGGSLSHTKLYTFLLPFFCLSAIAFFEPRDYRVVFGLQKIDKHLWKLVDFYFLLLTSYFFTFPLNLFDEGIGRILSQCLSAPYIFPQKREK